MGNDIAKKIVKNAKRETQDADNNFIDPGLNLKNTLHVLHSPQVLYLFFFNFNFKIFLPFKQTTKIQMKIYTNTITINEHNNPK